jgi:glycine cleavage system T protein
MPDKTSLHDITARAGADFTEDAGWLVPAHFEGRDAEYRRAREEAALFDVSHRGKVEVAGSDAASFLQNLSTNDVAGLPVGASCEAFFTTAQARVVAYALVHRLPLRDGNSVFWLDTDPASADRLIKHLDQYLISEQVELTDSTRAYAWMHLAGPQARAVLEEALGEKLPDLEPLRHIPGKVGGKISSAIRRRDALGVWGYDIACPDAGAGAVWETLTRSGAAPAGWEAYELLRIEAGTPVYGKDIDETNLALEVGRTRQAICYTKGCFLGQEPLVRIRDLGHINRSLTGLKIAGTEAVPHGAKLFRDGKEVGHVTSSVVSPRFGTAVALAYVRRGSDQPGTRVQVEPGGARRPAEVVGLPMAGFGGGN